MLATRLVEGSRSDTVNALHHQRVLGTKIYLPDLILNPNCARTRPYSVASPYPQRIWLRYSAAYHVSYISTVLLLDLI